jgi:DNA repair photolyase
MEALFFNCQVILAGNAYYESIDAVDVNLSETSLRTALRSISRNASIPEKDRLRALAALYYRNESLNYVSPLFGLERPPHLSSKEVVMHDQKIIESLGEYIQNNSYKEAPYYQSLISFFKSRKKRLCISNIMEDKQNA